MSTHCQIYLHPAVAGNPAVIRQIHAATGLRAVIGSNRHAPTLTHKAPAKRIADTSDVFAPFFLSATPGAVPSNPGTGPDGGDAA